MVFIENLFDINFLLIFKIYFFVINFYSQVRKLTSDIALIVEALRGIKSYLISMTIIPRHYFYAEIINLQFHSRRDTGSISRR